ncbi:MAG: TRAM domain-containing protein [Candidatus Omnitrophica bacterium]|nr:TRAM domain-containing protein [Candidatus Omnitrophota bacterium]MCM8828149.1 TRAM domain-containing protein [Candidatus Omnitrophota bacterium]
MGLYFIRATFVLISAFAGSVFWMENKLNGVIAGLIGSLIVVGLELLMQKIPFRKFIMAVFGLIVGLITAILIANFVLLVPFASSRQEDGVRFVLYFIFSYLGIMIGIRGVGELGFLFPYLHQFKAETMRAIVIDSSVAIDGRVHELAISGFIEGTIIIPTFIIKELQELADSASEMKRQRGRRGLETLNKMRNDNNLDVKVYDVDYPEIEGVDAKLVKLASSIGARILTNDFNLTKVAEVKNIKVLNLNNLATLMRAKLMAGETLQIKVVREGKEHGQGVGYLEDGTMVVIENGAKHIGKTVETVIDSAIQTVSGRIIFAKLK